MLIWFISFSFRVSLAGRIGPVCFSNKTDYFHRSDCIFWDESSHTMTFWQTNKSVAVNKQKLELRVLNNEKKTNEHSFEIKLMTSVSRWKVWAGDSFLSSLKRISHRPTIFSFFSFPSLSIYNCRARTNTFDSTEMIVNSCSIIFAFVLDQYICYSTMTKIISR